LCDGGRESNFKSGKFKHFAIGKLKKMSFQLKLLGKFALLGRRGGRNEKENFSPTQHPASSPQEIVNQVKQK
jgi:hypothetical protein